MSEPYRGKNITAKDVAEMIKRVGEGLREKYGPHLERMPERPGLTPEARHFIFGPNPHSRREAPGITSEALDMTFRYHPI